MVYLGLAGKDLPRALHTLLNVISELAHGFSEGLSVLLDERKDVLDVQLSHHVALHGLKALGDHLQAH